MTPPPAASRSVVVPVPSGRGVKVATSPLRWPNKSPGDLLDYSLDLAQWLADAADQPVHITATPIAVKAGDVRIADLVLNGNAITAWLTAGVAGTDYIIEVEITTFAGRLLHVQCLIFILTGLAAIAPTVPVPVSWQALAGLDFRVPSNLIDMLLF